MSKCRNCGQTIVWKKTKRGKNLPCQPKAALLKDLPQGTLMLTDEGFTFHTDDEGVMDKYGDREGYPTHFGFCTNPQPRS
jgi:hypothetical protein